MKSRILTCALLTCALLSDVAAKTANTVSMHGQLSETGVASNQKEKFNKNRGRMFLTMGSISIDGSLYDVHNRVKYIASMDITADMSTVRQQNPVLNSAYLSASGRFGEIKVGNSFSAATELMIDGTQLLGADGGFSGTSMFSTYNPSAYAIIMTGCYYDPGYATQITYMTPRFRGFQFGLTYVPNSLHVGLLPENDGFNSLSYGMTSFVAEERELGLSSKDLMAWGNGGFTSDVVAGGLRYDYGVPHHWNFSGAVSFWYGKANPERKVINPYKMHNLSALAVGFTVGYKHLKFGCGYVNQFKSALPKDRSLFAKAGLDGIRQEDWDSLTKGTEITQTMKENGFKAVLDYMKTEADRIGYPYQADLKDSGVSPSEHYDNRKKEIITLNGFGPGADAGQIFTAVFSYLPTSKIKFAAGAIYAVRKIAKSEKTKTYGGSLTFDYKVTKGVGLFTGMTYVKTKTCRRAVLIALSDAKSCGGFLDNHIVFFSAGVKMNF